MGTRPVTLCTAQWADVPFDELCVLAKKLGYDGLELWTVPQTTDREIRALS